MTLHGDAAAPLRARGRRAGHRRGLGRPSTCRWTWRCAWSTTCPQALEHIARWGTGHSEAIVADSATAIAAFTAGVDAAAVLVNASTRFTDGGEFGFGAEIGITTQKLHARGPLGLPELTSTTYVVTGAGHIR